jgi:general secretion pathway protein A
MYDEYFRFSGIPFRLSPDHRFYYSSTVHNRAVSHLKFGLDQGEGFILITGEVGAGKTTIAEHLLATLDSRKFVAANIVTTNLDQENMIRMVASAFGLSQEGQNKTTVFRTIERFIADSFRQGRRCLLFVDEAQNLSITALEELRMLSNLLVNGKPALQSFLLGQPQFRKTLARSELAQLRQRVIASYHLGPLSPQETIEYICHRLQCVGWHDDPSFDHEALLEIHLLSDGIPRRINTLCTRILLFAYLEEAHLITRDMVISVYQELEEELDQVVDHGAQTRQPVNHSAEIEKLVTQVSPSLNLTTEMAHAAEQFENELGQADDLDFPVPHVGERRFMDSRVVQVQQNGSGQEREVADLTLPQGENAALSHEDENRLMRRALHLVIDYFGGRHRAS